MDTYRTDAEQVAVQVHELYVAFMVAGFSEGQALYLSIAAIKGVGTAPASA